MDIQITPRKLKGTIRAGDSKSHAHRLLIAAALCREGHETRILCPGDNDDISATVRCLEGLGVRIAYDEGAPLHVLLKHITDGITAAATDPDDLDHFNIVGPIGRNGKI